MSRPTCASGNGEPTREGHTLGPSASWDLEVALGDVPWLDEQLEITLTRQGATTPGGFTTGSRERPLPLHVGAAMVRSEMRAVLVGWVRDLHETHGVGLPEDTVVAMARWMLAQRTHIETHEAAGEIWREVTSVVAHARRVIDRPVQREFVGVCDGAEGGVQCRARLYAAEGARTVACEACGSRHDVAQRMESVQAELSELLMTTTEIARMMARFHGLDRAKVKNRLTTWAARARIVPRSFAPDGTSLYPFGEVSEMVLGAEKEPRVA